MSISDDLMWSYYELCTGLVVAPHQVVGNRHDLAEHVLRRVLDGDVVAQRLAHLLDAVGADEQRDGENHLRFQAVVAHDVAADQQVKQLVGAAHLDVGLELHRVVGLRQRIQELVDADRLVGFEAFLELIALQHARHRVLAGELDEAGGAQLLEPGGVELEPRLALVENLERLLPVGFGILEDLFTGGLRPRFGPPGRIADHSREVADDENDLVPKILELLHLPHHHRVPEVDVGRRRIETDLDDERLDAFTRALELLAELFLVDQIDGPSLEGLELLGRRRKFSHRTFLLSSPNHVPQREPRPLGFEARKQWVQQIQHNPRPPASVDQLPYYLGSVSVVMHSTPLNLRNRYCSESCVKR